MKYIVSACLAGVPCRYDGNATPSARVLDLVRQGLALPVCPEQFGGLATPRPPCELLEERVITRDGQDLTAHFRNGAAEAVRLAQLAGCTEAILKSRSPSCGCGYIYDGHFSGTLVEGSGIFAKALLEAGITVTLDDAT